MKKYHIGQRIKLPAIKREGIRAQTVTVLEVPDRSRMMTVVDRHNGEFRVAVSRKTGRVLAQFLDCAIPY